MFHYYHFKGCGFGLNLWFTKRRSENKSRHGFAAEWSISLSSPLDGTTATQQQAKGYHEHKANEIYRKKTPSRAEPQGNQNNKNKTKILFF